MPDVIPFDPSRPYPGRSTDWNQGCPPGTFAQFTRFDAEAASVLPNGLEGVRCRVVTDDVDALALESLSWDDTLANLNAARTESQFHLNPIWWLVLGAIGIGIWERMQHGEKRHA